MPRGGGGFGGGGFGGGGFGGGGFGGGGFRGGGGGGFRSYGGRSSGRPFGRTGARRVTSGSSRGPYSHASTYRRRPYSRYYGWYYRRPWYSRWYYNPWFWGPRWRPFYYSPVYMGGGIVLAICLALIFLPMAGMLTIFPFSSAEPNGNVNYRSTETLYHNEYWYEYEYIRGGNEISFNIESSPGVISFAIWDRSFEELPSVTREGNISLEFNLPTEWYEYRSFFLKPGSSVDYSFNSTGNIDFLIVNGDNANEWYYKRPYTSLKESSGVSSGTGFVNIVSADDYYLIWYNEAGSSIDVEYTVDYIAVNVPDLAVADYLVEGVDNLDGDFIVPEGESRNWYFFVYFDPMLSPDSSVDITFDVTYTTGIEPNDRWLKLQPFLIGLSIFLVILLIVAVFARKGQKNAQIADKGKTSATAAAKTTTTAKTRVVPDKCIGCGAELRANASFCTTCGKKKEGRRVGASSKTTPARSKICSYCGSQLKSTTAKFCSTCGTGIDK